MTQLEDRRPVAATTTSDDTPTAIAAGLGSLLAECPELELASIRLIPNEDGTVGIAGRIGPRPTVECPQCHQPAGREHTDYCTLAPGKVWDGALPDTTCRCAGLLGRTIPGPQHSAGCPMRIVADR